ncbi:hypothetical protein [uncultured Microbacterium sp.]|uniref:hypothetical protein n=1 Tax=uncultured Microbacterium sp. TaxID=191216 RepID=UPI0025F607A2|nr:hypothetical protein [uncultured Microbacterium sp.]
MTDPVWPDMLATTSDYSAAYPTDPVPANLDDVLRSCTGLVQDATIAAVYAVDADGTATSPTIAKALLAATLVQARAWVKLGIDPATGGVLQAGTKRSKRLASAAIEYADAGAAADARAAAYKGLVPDAVRALQRANLLARGPWVL